MEKLSWCSLDFPAYVALVRISEALGSGICWDKQFPLVLIVSRDRSWADIGR